jgi:hypothetical protein
MNLALTAKKTESIAYCFGYSPKQTTNKKNELLREKLKNIKYQIHLKKSALFF